MALIPERITVSTSLSRKKLVKRLKSDLIEYKPSMNVLSTAKFMRLHREKSIYYGRCSGDRVQIFYHRAKKRDGGSTGFYGRIVEGERGCELTGSLRKPLYSYVSAAALIIICLLSALGTYANGYVKGAGAFLLVGAVGAVMMLHDDHKRRLKKYLGGLPKAESGSRSEGRQES